MTPSPSPPAALAPPPAPDDPSLELDAADARETAYAAMRERAWRGVPLLPWSKERDSILSRLLALDLPGRALEDLAAVVERFNELAAEAQRQAAALAAPGAPVEPLPGLAELVDFGLYYSAAAKLLFIAAHPPEDLETLRARPALFLRAVDEWAAENIAEDEVAAACLLAAEMRTAWRKFKPLARPASRHGRADDAGNSPRPS